MKQRVKPRYPEDPDYRCGYIMGIIRNEVERARAKFEPYNSAHEGISVIREEFEELWDEIKANKVEGAHERQMHEAVQVAATALRFIFDLASPDLEEFS